MDIDNLTIDEFIQLALLINEQDIKELINMSHPLTFKEIYFNSIKISECDVNIYIAQYTFNKKYNVTISYRLDFFFEGNENVFINQFNTLKRLKQIFIEKIKIHQAIKKQEIWNAL